MRATGSQIPQPMLFEAAWVAPMDGPPLRDAGVVFGDERIMAVGPIARLRIENPDAARRDVGNCIIIPGLVNAHTHLELSDDTPGQPPAGFTDWVIALMARSNVPDTEAPTRVATAIGVGVNQSLRFGVTTAGDITSHCDLTRPLLRESPLRVVSYGEVRAMASRRKLLDQRIAAAISNDSAGDRLRVGISPHSPYSVESDGYVRCLEAAVVRGLPVATHLAETADENAFLADHSAPLREIWDHLRAWDNFVPAFQGGPIRFAKAVGLLDFPSLLAHVNYCDDDELDLLAGGRASVAYCPRTHAYFGHPPHRWHEMLRRGVNVAIGTDSCASSPDLNLADDLRLLYEIAPDVPPLDLWQMATTRAAAALQWDQGVGSITPGKAADFAIFPVTGNDPLRELLENHQLPAEVWVAGERAWG